MITAWILSLNIACQPEVEADLESELYGLYDIDHWTVNDEGCEQEGPSVLGLDLELVINDATVFRVLELDFAGMSGLSVYGCVDPLEEDCAEDDDSAIESQPNGFAYHFDTGSDETGWFGELTANWDSWDTETDSKSCAGAVVEYTLHGTENGAIVESRTTTVSAYDVDDDGECSYDDLEQAALDQACSRLEVFSGTRR